MSFHLSHITSKLSSPSKAFKSLGNVLTLRAGGQKDKLAGTVAANFIPVVGPLVSAGLAVKLRDEVRHTNNTANDEVVKQNAAAQAQADADQEKKAAALADQLLHSSLAPLTTTAPAIVAAPAESAANPVAKYYPLLMFGVAALFVVFFVRK